MIVEDPDKEPTEDNIIEKPEGPCPHLEGDRPGEYSCAVHDKEWYEDTPCYAHGQIESSPDRNCRMGEYLLKKEREKERKVL